MSPDVFSRSGEGFEIFQAHSLGSPCPQQRIFAR